MSARKTTVVTGSLLLVLLVILVLDRSGWYSIADLAALLPLQQREDVVDQYVKLELVSKEDDRVILKAGYRYQTEYGPYARLSVTAYSSENSHKYRITVGRNVSAEKDSRQIDLVRPAHLPEAFETNRVKTQLRTETGELLAYRIYPIVIDWPSMYINQVEAESDTGSLWQYARNLFRIGRYPQLDILCDKWQHGRERTGDGRWRLSVLEAAALPIYSRDDRDSSLDKVRQWQLTNPGSECAVLVEAAIWREYAMLEYPYGSGDKVSETDLSRFRDISARAMEIYDRSRDDVSDNPLWYSGYIATMNQLGYDKGKILQVFLKAVESEPYFHQIYSEAAVALMPRWGGDYGLLEKFARDAVRLTKDRYGETMYTYIYWAVDSSLHYDDDFFRDTSASWTLMKRGFEELLTRYPDSDHVKEQYASFACRAGDGEAFLSMYSQLNRKKRSYVEWKDNYSLDVCEHMYMQRI